MEFLGSSAAGFMKWKLAVAIVLPTVVILTSIIMFVKFKVRARKKVRALNVKTTPQRYDEILTTSTNLVISPAVKGVDYR